MTSSAYAQTTTTRASRSVYSNFKVWYKPVNAQGVEQAGNWSQYGYVNFDVEVSEPVQDQLNFRVNRIQPVATASNTSMAITQSGCIRENANTRIRCFYTVKTTVNFLTTGIKQTSTFKSSGSGGVSAETPIGFKANVEGKGESDSSMEQNITPNLFFSRSFEFVVQLKNSCTTNPGYSVYYQGDGATPIFVPSQCLAAVAQKTKYCGGGSTPNRMANGQVDGEWRYTRLSQGQNNSTLQDRVYTLYRNGAATPTETMNTCKIAFKSNHVSDHVNWYNGDIARKNVRGVPTAGDPTWCEVKADEYLWDWQTGDYTTYKAAVSLGGSRCIGYEGSYKAITQPGYNVF